MDQRTSTRSYLPPRRLLISKQNRLLWVESRGRPFRDSTLLMSPVEGGSWIAASVCNAIVATAADVRQELLRLAQAIPKSPLKGLSAEDVALVNGSIAERPGAKRSVSIADAMREGNVDRIEKEKTHKFVANETHAHNVHSAIFAEVKIDEQIGIVRVTRVGRRRTARSWAVSCGASAWRCTRRCSTTTETP